MRRIFWILITPLTLFFAFWLIGSTFLAPKIEKWTLEKIQSYSRENLPVVIEAEQLHFSLLRPSLTLEDIKIIGQKDLETPLPAITISSLRAHLDLLHLLSGRITFSAIILEKPEVDFNIDPLLKNKGPAKQIPLDTLFAALETLPLDHILLKNLRAHIIAPSKKLEVHIEEGEILLSNKGKNLIAKAALPDLQVGLGNLGHFSGSLDTNLFLTPQALKIIQITTRLGESEIIASGELSNFKNVAIKPSGVLNISTKINLGDIHREMKKIRPNIKIPSIGGELATEVEARFDGLNKVKATADIKTRAVTLDNFQLGSARIQGDYSGGKISLSEIQVHHPSGEATLTKSEIKLDKEYNFKSLVDVKTLNLYKLFQSLNLANIPTGVEISGKLPCEGQILPSITVTCTNATLAGRNLWVKTDINPQTPYLVNIDQLDAEGQVQVDTKKVTYSAKLSAGENTGSSDGVIDFSTGFKINYKTAKLDLKNIRNLANLKMSGSTSIEGMTSGNASSATFEMRLNARNFIFEDFALGNLLTNLSYKSGHLFFQDIAGALHKTQYLGNLDVNLSESTLQGDFSAPTADLNDIALVFERIYKFPMHVQGLGAAKAHVEGPLSFWKLNYKLESAFKDLMLGPENLDELHFNASATDGNIKTDKVLLKRGGSTLTVQGGISSEKVMSLYADGKNWRLEESDLIKSINSNINGAVNFAAELKDHVTRPNLLLKGAITDTSFEDQEVPNSNFILNVNRESLGGQVSFFGNKVNGEFQIPLGNSHTPLIVKMQTQDWNYATLLGLIGGANLASEYESSLTSSVDLRSDEGELLKASGKILINTFSLKRSNLSFSNPQPIELTANNGVGYIKNFKLQGPLNLIEIRGNNFTADRLNLGVAINADLRLMQIFTPFLEDIGGPIEVSTNVSGSLQKPQILGSANTQRAFVKIKGFPHPLEKLSTQVIFSQSKILLNSIKGQIAGGTFNGDGGMKINGIRDLPTAIRLRLDGVTFNVPDKVRSSGDADLTLSGHWFPFTLSGTFHVSSALVEKEFTEDSSGVIGVRQSQYLPKLLRDGRFVPIILDLQVPLNRNIVIKNSLIDGSVTGQLQVKGAPENPILFGKIKTEKNSKIIFKDKIFEIQSGVIDFNNPNEINPNLYISANSRINEYDISLLAQGPSKKPTILLSSVPPLPEQDIISLIALGITSSDLDQNIQSRQQAEQLGVEIGGAVLAKPINKQLESTLGLNLQVTSQYDSTRNISVPKITLSRRLSEKVKVSGSRPVGDTQSYDIKLEYFLSNNLTAIGSFESRSTSETNTQSTQQEAQSIFGLDLEFKREFK